MARRLDLIESRPDIAVPSRESIIRLLLFVIEDDDALESVDLSKYALVNNHVADLLFGSLDGDTDQCCQPLQSDASVVLLNHSQVVLD